MRAARPKTGPHPPAFSGFASQLSAHALTVLVARDADIAPDLRHSPFGAGAETVGTESQRIVSIGSELTEIVYVRPLMVLKEGRVLTAGPPERALTRDALLRAYGVDVDVLPGPLGVFATPPRFI